MKIIGILNELYNNNKLENKRFKTPDGTILNNTEALLDYVGVSNSEWYSLIDLIETLQSEVEIIEEVEDKEYEDIEEIEIKHIEDTEHLFMKETINALIRNQKYILEQLNKESK